MNAPFDPARLRRVLVYGLGLSGLAAARLLRRRGVEVVGVDRRQLAGEALGALAGDPGFSALLGREPDTLPAGVDAIVASPGVPVDRPVLAAARAAGLPVVAEVELAFRLLEGTVVAVTGSNGKSTVTAMTGTLLAGAGFPTEVCGNIGLPLCDVVDGAPGRVFVVELSSFQLEGISRFRPRAAALLNLSPDHLDRHGSLAAYLAAKQRVFENQTADDVAVLNADETAVAETPVAARRRLFSRRGPVIDGCYVEGGEVVEVAPGQRPRRLFAVADVPVPGLHNLENAMAAALLARAGGASVEAIAPALASYRGLPHRLERVRERNGVVFYDDSKGTNVAATERSLEGFADGSVHLILGGRNKGADLAYLAPMVERKARRIYLIGESAEAFERALAAHAPFERCGTLDRAIVSAAAAARPGESVVLSPACASFDQFRDYLHRGEEFKRLVRELPAEVTVG